MVYVRRGKTTSNNVRSCDTVSAGAFFPQAQLQGPQKKMGQHCREHMMVPAQIFPHFIVGHAQFGFTFFKALFDGPAPATEPDQGAQRRARRGITDVVSICRVRPQGAFAHEPDRALWQPVLAERHTLTGKLIHDWPCGPFRDLPSIPTGSRQTRCPGCHGARSGGGSHHHPLRAPFPLLSADLRCGPRRLEPAAGVGRHRAPRRDPGTCVHGGQKVGAIAIEAIRRDILERQEPFLHCGLQHGRRQLRFALQGQRVGDVALLTSGGIRVGPPRLRQEQPLVYQGIAWARGLGGAHPALTIVDLAQGATVLPCDPYIAGDNIKRGHGKAFAGSPTGW